MSTNVDEVWNDAICDMDRPTQDTYQTDKKIHIDDIDSDSDWDSLLTSHQHAYNIHIITYIKYLTHR